MKDVDGLTEIWNSVTDDTKTTTEQQTERGNQRDISDFDGRIRETVTEMRDRYDIQTKLSNDQLVTVVRRFFAGDTDTEIAREIGDSSLDKTVSRARVRLHLFRPKDTDTEVNLDLLTDCFIEGHSAAVCGKKQGIAKSTANRYRRVITAQRQADRVNDEYRERFQRYCEEDDDTLVSPSSLDGLEEAVAGAGADNPSL